MVTGPNMLTALPADRVALSRQRDRLCAGKVAHEDDAALMKVLESMPPEL